MISLFSNDESPDAAQPIPVPGPKLVVSQTASQPGSQPPYSTAQHPAVSKTVAPSAAPAPEKHGIFSWLSIGKAKKRLQMLETVSLGEKRFVALVQVDGRQFLIGGAPSNVGMIAELAPEESFHQVLRDATQGINELPIPQVVQQTPTPVAQSVPIAGSEAIPAAAFVQPLTAVQAYPAPAAFSAPAEFKTQPVASVQAPVFPAEPSDKTFAPTPVTHQRVASPPIAAAAGAPTTVSSVATVAAPIPAPTPVGFSPAQTPMQHTSVAPFALAEAVLPSGATFSPAPAAAVKPSLPPHVAARLAELQAAIDAAPAPTASLLPDDLSLEEPVSLSPSLLAAMQQRARAALLNIEPQPTADVAAIKPAPLEELPVMQKAVPVHAPSFTFQFTPMLTSSIPAPRMPKLQGAA